MLQAIQRLRSFVHEKRVDVRADVTTHVMLHAPHRPAVPARIENLSKGGFFAVTTAFLSEGQVWRVTFPGGRAPHARLVWKKGMGHGFEFLSEVDLVDLLGYDPFEAPKAN
jgi:hypothetical protein